MALFCYFLGLPMFYRQALEKEIQEGLDRSQLDAVRKRFLRVNAARLERMQQALTDKQQQFIAVLPLLLHCNHPLLPGFFNKKTPAGLSGFVWTKSQVQLAKGLCRSFTAHPISLEAPQILSLFVMGSLGTIAHTPRSDFDIWLCYDPALDASQRACLQEKTQAISRWAQTLGLEVHFFLMNHLAFREGDVLPLSDESSGSAQRVLLLDEFYRTAIWLAGRQPLWWLVPPDVELRGDYSQRADLLLQQRFVFEEDFIDFGSSSTFAANEFLGAGLWQLYKAIESPYKAVLKLLLLEVYVSQAENFCSLSLAFKRAIYRGNLDIDQLDPYVAAFEAIEGYLLQRDDHTRLELFRRSFYFKVNKALSRKPSGKTKSWQRRSLEEYVKRWQWSPGQVAHLDGRASWKALDVLTERDTLVATLMRSFLELNMFSRRKATASLLAGMDFMLLSNKLAAAFSSKPGKLLAINPGISKDVSVSRLWLKQNENTQWQLYDNLGSPALHECWHLAELLTWACYNGILLPSSQIIWPNLLNLPIERGRYVMQTWLYQQAPAPHQAFEQPAAAQQLLVMVNWPDSAPAPTGAPSALQNTLDCLNYGTYAQNLLRRLDVVLRNSWGELYFFAFCGEEALLDFIRWYWREAQQTQAAQWQIEVVQGAHASAISQRLDQLLRDIMLCFSRHTGRQSRYLFAMGGKLYSLQWQSDDLLPLCIFNEKDLWNFLSVSQDVFRPLVVDSLCLPDQPLAVVAKYLQPGSVSLFYTAQAQGLTLYIADPKGAILRLQVDRSAKLASLLHWVQFLTACIRHITCHALSRDNWLGVISLSVMELSWQNASWQVQRKSVDVPAAPLRESTIKVCVGGALDIDTQYRIFCNEQEFLPKQGDDIWEALAFWAHAQRSPQDISPLLVDEIEFIDADPRVGVMDYVKTKLSIETQLNRALFLMRKTGGL
jgi:adenylate cyclase, class 1